MEQWRPIPGYEGLYEASSLGRIKSLARTDRFGRPVPERILRLRKSLRGALMVGLSKGGEQYTTWVPRLVLAAFEGVRPSHTLARHLDGDNSNNARYNLAWGTYQENSRDMVRHGTTMRGEKNRKTKLKDGDIRTIRASSLSNRALAIQYGMDRSTISQIRNGHVWKHIDPHLLPE